MYQQQQPPQRQYQQYQPFNQQQHYYPPQPPPPQQQPQPQQHQEEPRQASTDSDVPKRRKGPKSFTETQSKLTVSSRILLTNPSDSPEYQLRLYPHALERSALLTQNEAAELCAIEGSQAAYDEEKGRVEDEWRNRKDKMRERLLEGLEERRRKAREEMASDGVLADAPAFEPPPTSSRTTEKRADPPFILAAPHPFGPVGEEVVSPFPLPLTAGGSWGTNARKRQKGVGPQGGLQLGRAITALTALKENEVEGDLGEVRKAAKRKRRVGAGVPSQMYRD